MPVKYQRVWDTMNDLEMIISKVVSAREMIDIANEALEYNQKERAEKLTMAAYEFLGYFIEEFDEKFKDAWQATVGDLREGDVLEKHQNKWNDFWEKNYYPEEYGLQYTDDELNAMCDAAEKSQSKHSNPFDEQVGETLPYSDAIAAGWTMTDDGFWIPPQKENASPLPPQQEYLGWQNVSSDKFDKMFPENNKVKKWILPVEIDGPSGEYFICFPDDLMLAANLEEGDRVEWIDNKDGSYIIRKVSHTLKMEEC